MSKPERLYKYRPINDRTKDIILEHRVYFSAPATFNDPFDCKMPLDFSTSPDEFEAYVRDLVLSREAPVELQAVVSAKGIKGFPDSFFENLREKYRRRLADESSLFCMSECRDNILMFSHYADNHHGCCLEFDSTSDSLLRRAERVTYQTNYPDLNYFRLHRKYSLMAQRLFLTKADSWAYEKEWRVLRDKILPGYYSILPSCLTGIILGALISDGDKALVREWVKQRGVPVQFYQASINSSSFALDIKPVT